MEERRLHPTKVASMQAHTGASQPASQPVSQSVSATMILLMMMILRIKMENGLHHSFAHIREVCCHHLRGEELLVLWRFSPADGNNAPRHT